MFVSKRHTTNLIFRPSIEPAIPKPSDTER